MSEEATFDQMALDLKRALGIDATFIPTIGDRVSGLKIFFEQRIADQPGQFVGTAKAYEYEVEFYFSDIGRLPEVGEQFLIGSAYYSIARVIEHDLGGRFCKVICTS